MFDFGKLFGLYPAYAGKDGAPAGEAVLDTENPTEGLAGDTGFVPEGDDIEAQFLKHLAETDEEYQGYVKDVGKLKNEAPADSDELLPGETPKIKPTVPDSTDDDVEDDQKKADDPGDDALPKEDDSLPPSAAKEGDSWIDDKTGKEYEFKGEKWLDKDDGQELKISVEDEADDQTYEYPDNVIPGLKGEHFKIMPKDAQEAIAKYHDENVVLRKSVEQDQAVINAIKNDPIAKHRIEMIKSGRAYNEYQMPTVSEDEVNKILDTGDKATATKLIQKAAERLANVARDNERIRDETKRKIEETNRTGETILREAGNMHPELFDEKQKIDKRLKDFSNADQVGTEENKIYSGYHQKIVDFCQNRGYRYTDIAKMKPAELYALVAVNEGWPISINTKKRDTMMVAEATQKALQHFRVSKRGRELAQGMRQIADVSGRRHVSEPYKVEGIDVVKLATDNTYHERVLSMKYGKPEWIDRVADLRRKGEEIVQKRKRTRDGS
jgi:hypothetical protein